MIACIINKRETPFSHGSKQPASKQMADRQDIDHILNDWAFEPEQVSVRLVETDDDREVLQMRVEMGILQLELSHRPDAARPGGAESYFDYLVMLAVQEGSDFELTEEQCSEVDREFMQFYQRRICWLALRQYARAVRDADHNIALLDFIRTCSPDEEWTQSHEQYRPFVLFHRTQAACCSELERGDAASAIEELNAGLKRIRMVLADHQGMDEYEDDEFVQQLVDMRETLRNQYSIGRTLKEQLADAVAGERYELAARLRDEIDQRHRKRA